ncbi:hypothetical protein VTK56DRAFT_1345 [Thermocarpiscus australiensis]
METAKQLPGKTDRAEAEEAGDRDSFPHARRASRASRAAKSAKAAPLIFLSFLLFAFLIVLRGHGACLGQRLLPPKPKSIEERVKHILTHTPLIDGHNDLAILIRSFYNNHIYNENFTKPFTDGGLVGHVDLPRLRAGMSGGAFWSVFWPCPDPKSPTDFSDERYAPIVQQTLQQIDLLARLQRSHPSVFSPPTVTAATALHHFRRGRLISPLGLEGLHHIGNSAATLRRLHALGVRYATLTHNCPNRYADSALWEAPLRRVGSPVWGGVSAAGRDLVREMNRLGVVVDLSHTSEGTMVDVLGGGRDGWQGSRAPVIFSHSGAYGVCPHPRNVPDRVLEMVRRKRGLVMVNFSPEFVSCVEAPGREDGLPDFYPPNSTLQQVARHVLYVGKRIGFDHVGFGSDFDGIQHTPEGLEDVSKFPDLVAELLRQGLSDEDAAKVVGGNLLRVWKEVEDVAEKMQKEGVPVLEDDLPGLFPTESRIMEEL